MRRIVLWAAVTVTVLVLLFSYRTSTSATMAASSAIAPQVRSTAPAGGSGAGAASGTGSGAGSRSGASSGTGSTASGTYTGDAVDTQWGPVQVQVTVQSGKITAAQAIVYPQGNGRSQQINAYAIPTLNQEVVDKQSASIDMVSGATVTSGGYIGSLQAALNQAHL